MMSVRLLSGLLGALFAMMSERSAGAQQMVSSLDELKILASTHSKVTVTDENGRQFSGTIDDASSTLLSLRIAGTIHRFAAADVRSVRVRKEDPVLNGVLIGAAVGSGLTSLMFLDNECRDDPACYTAVAVYGSMGALAGLGVDALIHRNVVVYSARALDARRAATTAPLLARGRFGVRLAISW